MTTPPGDYPPNDPNQPPGDPHQPPGYGQGGYGQGGYDQGGYGGQYPPPGGGYPQGGGYQQPKDHPRATTSLVVGIVGVVCCSIAAPFAWAMGKKAVNEIDASGGMLGGRGQAQAGYILGIIGTVLLVIGVLFFLLAAITGGLSFEAGTNIE